MLGKIISMVGILACLLAAEGLHRFGSFVGAMKGGDTPFYMGMLVVALFGVLLFILSLVGKLSKTLKWLGIVGLLVSVVLMFLAPALPVNVQIMFALAVGVVCLFFAPAMPKVAPSEVTK